MSNEKQQMIVKSTGSGISLCGILFIILLLLKVGVLESTVVGWSWWLVTAPLWGPLALCVILILCIGVICLLGFWVVLFVTWCIDAHTKRKLKQRAVYQHKQDTKRASLKNKLGE